ncbi:MAG: glycoside hydrolase family 127 protein [Kiritimatiellae bacterium]|nr:glycoside hydrolase family 127 protein [Kiritimatiellia bacterium]
MIAVLGMAALPAAMAVGGSLADCGTARLKGYLGERLDAMIANHVAATDVDYITAPFLEKTESKRWWQTEFWGKWMHSAVPYLGYCGSEKLRASIDRGVERMIASQELNGYIGNYPDELRCGEGWDVWGMKYTLMGLLHYYDWKRHEESNDSSRLSSNISRPTSSAALDACRRLCDYVIAEIGPNGRRGRELWQTGNWSGYASSSILEPVMFLYKRTKERKYLDFAAYIVKGMSEPEAGPRLVDLALKGVSVADRNGYGNTPETGGGYVMKHNRWKAYEMMSCYQGFLEYYEATGRKDLFDAAVKTGEDIAKEEINLAGGCSCSEAWFHGARKQHLPHLRLQETCVTTTWMRFCEKLLDMTDDPKWADQLERTFYNAYLGAMKLDGSEFAGYTPLSGNRYHGQHHCFMHTDCCTANGPRGFLCFLRKFFTTRGGAATFNFYSSALVKGELDDGRKVAFDMYSLYPRGNYARIVSHTERVGSVPLRLRVPSWSANTSVSVNGKAVGGAVAGGYCTIEREWKLGDVVEIKFDMPVVAHSLEHHVAFTRGPVLLARDSRFGDGDMTEPIRRGLKDGQTMHSFNSVRSPSDDMWMAFSATLPMGSHHENPEGALPTTVFFCDYASAGNKWQRDNYYRTWFPVEYGPAE